MVIVVECLGCVYYIDKKCKKKETGHCKLTKSTWAEAWNDPRWKPPWEE